MPRWGDVLELYYHCKLCSDPQAYLEQEAFLMHVQEFHADHYQPEGAEIVVVPYPESKTAEAQVIELTQGLLKC